jgi:LacI family transcriptional regulator
MDGQQQDGRHGAMTPRVTLRDIAARAGVSPATVDRVLNDRPGVHRRTRDAVLNAARAMGYIDAEVAAAPEVGTVELVFLLPQGTNTFMTSLAAQLERQAAARPHLRATVEWLRAFDPQTVAGRLAELQGRIDGLALI